MMKIMSTDQPLIGFKVLFIKNFSHVAFFSVTIATVSYSSSQTQLMWTKHSCLVQGPRKIIALLCHSKFSLQGLARRSLPWTPVRWIYKSIYLQFWWKKHGWWPRPSSMDGKMDNFAHFLAFRVALSFFLCCYHVGCLFTWSTRRRWRTRRHPGRCWPWSMRGIQVVWSFDCGIHAT